MAFFVLSDGSAVALRCKSATAEPSDCVKIVDKIYLSWYYI